MGTRFSGTLLLTWTNTVRQDRLAASSDESLDGVVDGDHGLHVRQGAGSNEDFPTTRLALEALRNVYHVAYDRVFHTLFGANVANDGFPVVDANTNMQGG